MRITNKIIQNNSLTNVNNNKILQDKLSTQLATGKKIDRPSEDPIVALRSLRLRTSVNQTDQYLNKNVTDARSWLTVTEDAIGTLSEIITDMRKQYVKGSSDSLTVSDREIIRESLEAFQQEVFNTGNADFAGRSVFTGYRTESPLTFQTNEDVNYKITQTFRMEAGDEKSSAMLADKIDYVNAVDLKIDGTVEQQVEVFTNENAIDRFRLAYNNCTADDITITFNGTAQTVTATSVNDIPSPYLQITQDPDSIIFINETGEVLLGKNVAQAYRNSKSEITVEYNKSDWNKGDLCPEHYFQCTKTVIKDGTPTTLDYNVSGANGEIEYNIGVNQTLRVNTLANECFNHDIARDIDDMIAAIDNVEMIEKTLSELKSELDSIPETQQAQRKAVQDKIDAARKAQTYYNDILQKTFSKGITKADNYLNRNNLALTDCGTRSKRLDLIENRLDTQMFTLEELKSDNEDADYAETAIKLSSATYAYDAALMATGKIMKESLLDYI